MRSSGLVLFVCAGLLLSGGAILGGSSAFTLLRMSYYIWTTDLGAELASTIMFITGAFLCLPSCWLATLVPYHTKSISILVMLMLLTTTSMMLLSCGMSALTGLSRVVREPSLINASMLRALSHEPFDPAVRAAFAAMQIELKCCGVQSYTDWYNHRKVLPPSCCGRLLNGKNGELCLGPPERHSGGCLRPVLLELRVFINSTCVLASALISVMCVLLTLGKEKIYKDACKFLKISLASLEKWQKMLLECSYCTLDFFEQMLMGDFFAYLKNHC